MRRVLAICRKELELYFYSHVSYVAFALYFLILSLLFCLDFTGTGDVDVRPLFSNVIWIYVMVIPLLTMRLISDELARGTDELLLTSPASIFEIVFGKYLAAFTVQFMLIAVSFVYPLILSKYGPLDPPILWLSFLGAFLVGAALMAVGLFASSLTAYQMVAAIAAIVMTLVLWMIDYVAGSVFSSSQGQEWIKQFSLLNRMQNMQRGIFDLTDLLFFVTFIILFIVLSMQVLERKRMR